ncbi:MAG: aldehyde dehydrogenase family protein, partial [Chloroflexota bacterium]|nr:aldehyde dehydrogenase family protein [Chloroflexota bacterium]
MARQPVLIAGEWRQSVSPSGWFSAVDPASGRELEGEYPVSGFGELERALEAAQEAKVALRGTAPEGIARFLEAFADAIEERADAIAEMAHVETGLPLEPRLRQGELLRTTDQLRQAAAAARERSWCQATIDTKNGIRSKYGPLDGPVVIFGPNNFPLA